MNTRYIAKFVIEGFPEFMTEMVQKEFARLYNRFAEKSEDFYAVKNVEFDKFKESNPDTDYNAWMADQVRKVVSEYRSPLLRLDVGSVDCNIFGVGKGVFKNGRVDLFIEEA